MPDILTPERIAEKRRIAEAATRGPWALDGVSVITDPHASKPPSYTMIANVSVAVYQPLGRTEANAAHIADNDPPSVLEMLDAIERLTAERDEALAQWPAWAKSIYDKMVEYGAFDPRCDGPEIDLGQVVCEWLDGYQLDAAAQRDAALSEAKALREAGQVALAAMELALIPDAKMAENKRICREVIGKEAPDWMPLAPNVSALPSAVQRLRAALSPASDGVEG